MASATNVTEAVSFGQEDLHYLARDIERAIFDHYKPQNPNSTLANSSQIMLYSAATQGQVVDGGKMCNYYVVCLGLCCSPNDGHPDTSVFTYYVYARRTKVKVVDGTSYVVYQVLAL